MTLSAPFPTATATTGTPKLLARGLQKRFGRREVVSGVDLELSRGEIVALFGPNGAGKTTTFYMMVGFVRPDAGTIHLNGADITRLPMHQRARLGLGYLPQEPSAFRKMTDRKSTRLNSSHPSISRMPSSA